MLISSKHKQIVLPPRAEIINLPQAKLFEFNGQKLVTLPHDTEHTKYLKNIGIVVPAPIAAQYQWPGTPFESQRTTAELLTLEPRAYVLSDMGVGKTRAALFAYDFLRQRGEVKRMLIVAPLSTLTTVWAKEAFDVCPQYSVEVIHGTTTKRKKLLASKPDIAVINHDGVETVLGSLVADRDIDVVVIDELAVLRNQRTNRWKAHKTLVESRKYAWGLTGSPTPNAPTDAWGQAKLMTPWTVPKYFGQFREQCMYKITQFKWVNRPQANDEVFRVMQPAVRFTREDVITQLPPTTRTDRPVQLSKDQTMAYRDIMQEYYTEYGQNAITAANEGVKLSKLLQVSLGVVYSDDGSVVTFKNTFRNKELENIVNSTTRKVLVFVPYKNVIPGIVDHLNSIGITNEVITGDTPKRNRDIVINNFRNTPDPRIIVAHPGTMAHGLTLVEADTIVWYGPITSAEIYDQANARITRPGQKFNTLIVHMYATKAEQQVYYRLANKLRVQGVLLDMFKEQTKGE